MISSIYLDFVFAKKNFIPNSLFLTGSFAAPFLILSVLICRVYFAAHSINQVIFGAVIGVEIAVFLHFSVKPAVYDHLSKLS